MLKALDDLERAVGRMLEKARGKPPAGSRTRDTEAPVDETLINLAARKSDQNSEEAAELIRRAIKRLKSL